MLSTLIGGNMAESLLAARQPGTIIGPISTLLGKFYNSIFNFIFGISERGALGLAIIVFTIIIKTVLIPLIYKQQKSSYKMQKLQPKLDKIKAKYKGKDDQSSKQKMALEMQKLQKDNGVSMMGGCLPLLIQLPILYALFYIFQQAYAYVDVINQVYSSITNIILSMPVDFRIELLTDTIMELKMKTDVALFSDIIRLVNEISISQWDTIIANAGEYSSALAPLIEEKAILENFIGISLVNKAGLGFPGIIIPLLSAGSSYLLSKVMMRNQKPNPDDPTAATMKIMNNFMPIMMGAMTVTMPAGLGLYWTVSNIIQIVQTILFNAYFKRKDEKGEVLQNG